MLLERRKSAISCPFPSVEEQPHNELWALKSPSRRTGGGSCETRLSKSVSVQELVGGRYIEQTVMGCGIEIRQATACRLVFKGRGLCGIFRRIKIPVPPWDLVPDGRVSEEKRE